MQNKSETRHGRPNTGAPPLFVSTGCTSSDVFLVPVLAELHRRGRLGTLAGMGGSPLEQQGVNLLFDTTPVSTVGWYAGFSAMLSHAGVALRAMRDVAAYFRRVQPALAILVDNPGQNLRILSLAQRHKVPVLYYIPPETWSLFPWQLCTIARKASAIAAVLPSEVAAYETCGANVCWVGHPAVDLLSRLAPAPEPDTSRPIIGLFPGSRRHEVEELLPVLRGAAEIIVRHQPGARFTICAANEVTLQMIAQNLGSWTVPVELARRGSHEVMRHCSLLLTCAGTATLEAAILGVPMVVMYRLHCWADRFIRQFVMRDRYFSLPNYLLRRTAVPELLNEEANACQVAREGLSLLRDGSRRRTVLSDLATVREMLGPPGAISRVADMVEELLSGRAHAMLRAA